MKMETNTLWRLWSILTGNRFNSERKVMLMNLFCKDKCLGYYIVEALPKPEWCLIDAQYILSPTSELTRIYPDLTKCYWINYPKSEKKDYAVHMGIGEEEFIAFENSVSDMIDNDKVMAIDGRFNDLQSAMKIRSFFKNQESLKIIAIYTKFEYVEDLVKDGCLDNVGVAETTDILGNWLGNDILGSDCINGGYFYYCSYLSNSLEQKIKSKFEIKFSSSIGLIQNTFEETEEFCDLIQGMGEYVIWMPYSIFEIEY